MANGIVVGASRSKMDGLIIGQYGSVIQKVIIIEMGARTVFFFFFFLFFLSSKLPPFSCFTTVSFL